jgi:flagellar motor switch protein FliN/FliY
VSSVHQAAGSSLLTVHCSLLTDAKEGGKMEEFVTENQATSNTKKFELNMDSLLDVSVEISVEIGRTKISIGELLALSKGSVVELNRLAGESVDVYVNEKLLGKGEIVVVNERLGVRVTEIVTPKEMVQKLG